MKTIMVIDDETSVLEEVKSCLQEDDFDVIGVDNSRKAIELMDSDRDDNFRLILINTILPDSKQPAFFSMKPNSKSNIDTSRKEDFLQKPFTKEELKNFVKGRIESD